MANSTTLSIAIAQCNFTVGDVDGNARLICKIYDEAVKAGADLVVYSELALVGYPPEDLLLRPAFQDAALAKLDELAAYTKGHKAAMLLGGIWRQDHHLYNTAFLLAEGEIADKSFKHDLPNYGVFDEKRLFTAAQFPTNLTFRNIKLGVMICRDMWHDGVAAHLAQEGAEMFIVLNASPFEHQKQILRLNIASQQAHKAKLPLIYVNQVGGQDEVVFDGRSFIIDSAGTLQVELPKWQQALQLSKWAQNDLEEWVCQTQCESPPMDELESIYQAMMMGVGDYVRKNKFPHVIIGMSGGIDSALTASVAVDSLGAKQVHLVAMPSEFTSEDSIEDAKECARYLGCNLEILPIDAPLEAMRKTMKNYHASIVDENLQPRIRGMMLMAMSNKTGGMVLTTGNKSEMAVGYATLYGDMCGGFNVLKDIYKSDVYRLASWRNNHLPVDAKGPKGIVIPENIITKPPSAELRPDQTDQDSLPPYDQLDTILKHLIEDKASRQELIDQGFEDEIVNKVARLLYNAEYKRRQSPPGVKITNMSFGRDRRYPITNRFF